MEVTLKIFRYDPKKDDKPRYQKYKVNSERFTTILDCLNEIKWHQDGTLTFRKSCRSAICGSCAVMVNGEPKLACKTKISAIKNSDNIVIEPLTTTHVKKDLVVDTKIFWDHIKRVMPWLIPKDNSKDLSKENLMPRDDLSKFKNSELCIMCMCCYFDCKSIVFDKKILGPAAFAKSYRFIVDPRDSKRKERLIECLKNGLSRCNDIYCCMDQCPKDIKLTELVSDLKEFASKEGIKGNEDIKRQSTRN